MRSKLILLLIVVFSRCMYYDNQLLSHNNIKYKYLYSEEFIAGKRTFGHVIYVKNISTVAEEELTEFSLWYGNEHPNISKFFISKRLVEESTERGDVKYIIYFYRNGDSLSIKEIRKY